MDSQDLLERIKTEIEEFSEMELPTINERSIEKYIEEFENDVETFEDEWSEARREVEELQCNVEELEEGEFDISKMIDQQKLDLLKEKELQNIPLDKLEQFLKTI